MRKIFQMSVLTLSVALSLALFAAPAAAEAVQRDNWQGLFDSGITAERVGDNAEALAMFSQALVLAEGFEAPDTRLVENLERLARVHQALGSARDGLPLRQRAFDLRQADRQTAPLALARAAELLAQDLRSLGRNGRAATLYREALFILEENHGSSSPALIPTLRRLSSLVRIMDPKSDEAISMTWRWLTIVESSRGPQHRDAMLPLKKLSDYYLANRDYDTAVDLRERALEILEQTHGPNSEYLLSVMKSLARIYSSQERHDAAEIMYRRALSIQERQLGARHPNLADTMSLLGSAVARGGDVEAARPILEEGHAIVSFAWGADHPTTVHNRMSMLRTLGETKRANGLRPDRFDPSAGESYFPDVNREVVRLSHEARKLIRVGELEQAEAARRQILALIEDSLGADSYRYATATRDLARLFQTQQVYEVSEELMLRALETVEKRLPAGDARLATRYSEMAMLYTKWRRYDEAETFYVRKLETLQRAGERTPAVARAFESLAKVAAQRGDEPARQAYLEQAAAIWEQVGGREAPEARRTLRGLANAYIKQERFAEAEQLLTELIQADEGRSTTNPHHAIWLIRDLARMYRLSGNFDDGKLTLMHALELEEEQFSPDNTGVACRLRFYASEFEKMGDDAQAEALRLRADDIVAKCGSCGGS